MSCDHALRLTSILLAAASFIGLALSGSLPDFLLVVTGSVLIIVLLRVLGVTWIDRLTGRFSLSQLAWNLILLTGFATFWIDMLIISGELLPAGIHFLLVLMVVKLCNLQVRRDYLHLYAISLMAILASAAQTTDVWYVVVFVAYLLAGVWTLLLFHLTRRPDAVKSPVVAIGYETAPAAAHVTPHLFWLANGLAIGTLCLTLAMFFAIPRISAGLLQQGYGESIRTSGFSDTVDLGAIGPVKRDPSIVMRVEVSEGTPAADKRLYLRGAAYDRYDGASWTNQLTHRRALQETAPGTFTITMRQTVTGNAARRYKIMLEPLDTAVLFVPPFAETVTGQFLAVQADAAGALSLPFPSASRIEYAVVARNTSVHPADLQPQTGTYPEIFARHFLQTPAESGNIAALATAVTREKAGRYDKALALEQFLAANYRYSLDVPLARQTSPIEEFLFTRKSGYCEHYATAMVIMLRSIGIPARLVTGFLATEWNEYGNYFVVRQQDAHAWVEVHLPRSGWVMMDPTPAVTESSPPAAWRTFGRILDTLRLRWNRLFVQYSAADQIAVVREIKASGASARTRAWDSAMAFLTGGATEVGRVLTHLRDGNLYLIARYVGLVLLGVAGIVWVLWRVMRTGGPQAGRPAETMMMVQLYKTMLHHLARNGLVKPDATAPIEFATVVGREWTAAASPVARLTELYCRGRFGGQSLTAEEYSLAQASLKQLIALTR